MGMTQAEKLFYSFQVISGKKVPVFKGKNRRDVNAGIRRIQATTESRKRKENIK